MSELNSICCAHASFIQESFIRSKVALKDLFFDAPTCFLTDLFCYDGFSRRFFDEFVALLSFSILFAYSCFSLGSFDVLHFLKKKNSLINSFFISVRSFGFSHPDLRLFMFAFLFSS
jgi:hypothetical protein